MIKSKKEYLVNPVNPVEEKFHRRRVNAPQAHKSNPYGSTPQVRYVLLGLRMILAASSLKVGREDLGYSLSRLDPLHTVDGVS
jgi:hypothetical protein